VPTANPAAVRKQIAAGTPEPIYVLLGDDAVEKAALAHEFEALVEEGLRAFNIERIHAGDATTGDRLAAAVANVIDAARTLPMMSPRRVVIVLQAEGILQPKRESDAAARALTALEGLFKAPEAQTTLVLVAGTLDRRSRMFNLLKKQAIITECGVIEDQADAERWITSRVSAGGMTIEPAAARLLAERCGTNVKRLRNDVDRLLLYAMGQKRVTVADVREIAGAAALSDHWAMTNAIERRAAPEALRQLALLFDAGTPAEMIVGQLGWLVRSKFPGDSLPHSIDAVFRTDLAMKQSAGDPRVLLERLVVELCGVRPTAARFGRR
jgi:DNA polymerase-3 subunit delta